jgi:hypothetical protein
MGLIDKANNRERFPVVLSDRTIHVRAMTGREIRRLESVQKDLKTPFVMGLCVVTEAGRPEMPQGVDESDADFAKRVEGLLSDADVDTLIISKISHQIGKIGKVDVEDIRKN